MFPDMARSGWVLGAEDENSQSSQYCESFTRIMEALSAGEGIRGVRKRGWEAAGSTCDLDAHTLPIHTGAVAARGVAGKE